MNLVVFGLFAAVGAVCAWIALSAARKCVEQSRQVSVIVTALSNERGRIAAHSAEIEQITATLHKLSGRLGAVRKEAKNSAGSSGDPDDVANVNRLTWKAEMREKYGLATPLRK